MTIPDSNLTLMSTDAGVSDLSVRLGTTAGKEIALLDQKGWTLDNTPEEVWPSKVVERKGWTPDNTPEEAWPRMKYQTRETANVDSSQATVRHGADRTKDLRIGLALG